MESRSLWSRFEVWGVAATTVLALASYWLASYSPLYTDEVGWKLIQSRFVDDGFHSRSATLAPGCGPDLVSTPTLLIPARYLDSFVGGLLSSPSAIRCYGLFLFLVWLVVAWELLSRLFAPVAGRWTVMGLLAGVVTLGVMPFVMVLSRPEQVLLIGTTVFLVLAVDEKPRSPSSLGWDLASAAALIAGGAIVFSCHQRAFLVLPIAVLTCFRVIERRDVALVAACAITAIAVVAFGDFNARLACPGDAVVRMLFNRESIVLAASNHLLPNYISRLTHLMRDYPGLFLFLTQFDFLDYYISNMIPAYPFPLWGTVISLFLTEFMIVVVLTGLVSFGLTAVGRVRHRQGLIALCAIASSWLIYFVSIFARATRNNYEAELMEPLLVLTSVLSIWLAREDLSRIFGRVRVTFFARALFAGLIILSVVSQIALLVGYEQFVGGAWGRPGYIPKHLYSASVSGYSSIRGTILSAAARCDIKPNSNLKYLVVDEVTYFPFRHSKAPHLMTNIDPRWWGRGIPDLRALLANRGSDGAIVGCHWLPRSWRSYATRTGEFCCLPKSKI